MHSRWTALETEFSQHRSTFNINPTQLSQRALTQTTFDNPFSKRLNLTAGAGLTSPSRLPVKTSGKTSSWREALAKRCSCQSQKNPRENRQPRSGIGIGCWKKAVVDICREPMEVAGEEARATNNQTAHSEKCRAADNIVPMGIIDEEGEPKGVPKRTKEGSRAQSCCIRRGLLGAAKTPVSAPEKAGNVRESVGADIEEPVANLPRKPPSKKSDELAYWDSLRSRFARLSGGDVHVAAASSKKALRAVDEMDMGQEEAEVATPCGSDGKQRRDKSPVEVMKPPSTKSLGSRKAKQPTCDTGKTPTEPDGDVIMDLLDPSTSPQLANTRGPTAKVIETDGERQTII
ncbi:hypothetical protein APHAL10511_007804 [Amanita phalloides]|nr:hypothetical protein APHAL10511_007804 [Amanita phalloides]